MSPVSLTSAAVKALTAQETGEVFLLLVRITHELLTTPLYFVNNTVDITSRGNTYLAWPFQIALPDEREDALPQVQLQIDNVDRRIMEGVRLLPTPATVALEVILASSPDTVERGPFNFRLVGVQYTALVITATLAPEDVLNEPAMAFSFTPDLFPGLYP